jgi:spore coat protein U-like protein
MSSRAWSNVPIGLIGGAVLLLAAGPVAAQVQSETLTVQARIGDLCSVTAALLDFGPGIDITDDSDAEGSIEINCIATTPLEVELDGGQSPDFGGGRKMTDGESTLTYLLFKDAARSQLWAPGERVPATVSSTGSVTVYGRVPEQQDGHAAGLYTDEVTITLVF